MFGLHLLFDNRCFPFNESAPGFSEDIFFVGTNVGYASVATPCQAISQKTSEFWKGRFAERIQASSDLVYQLLQKLNQ
jgi:hypothetical protein